MAFRSVVSVGGTLLSKSGSTYGETSGPTRAAAARRKSPSPPGSTTPAVRGGRPTMWRLSPGMLPHTILRRRRWFIVGGTSVGTPIIAGVFALAGNATEQRRQKVWKLTQ